MPVETTIAMKLPTPAAAPSQPSPSASALASLSTVVGKPVWAATASRSGKPLQPGMLSGETVTPPSRIGPPHPTPHDDGWIPIAAARASTRSISEATPGHGSSGGVGIRSRTSTAPDRSTTPTSSFVPPMSTASTDATVRDGSGPENSV